MSEIKILIPPEQLSEFQEWYKKNEDNYPESVGAAYYHRQYMKLSGTSEKKVQTQTTLFNEV